MLRTHGLGQQVVVLQLIHTTTRMAADPYKAVG